MEGLAVALANIDDVIRIIKSSKDRQDAMEKLENSFLLSDKQAAAILDMRLQRLTSLEVEKINEELDTLKALIIELRGIIASEEKVKDIIFNELTDIVNRYGDDRKTEISYDASDINIEDLIEKEDVVISMTHFGYIKRVPVAEYRAQKRGGMGATAHKPKEEDFVNSMFITSTHDDIMFFTNKGKVYTLKGYEIPEGQKQARGRAIINLLELAPDEKVNTIMPRPADKEGFLIIATVNGMIKKTPMSEYSNIRKSGKIAIALREGDELISVQQTTGDSDIVIATREGKCIRFKETDCRVLGRDTVGVTAIELSEEDFVVDMIAHKPGYDILTITERGYGKRSSIDEYRLQSRKGKGIKAGVFNDKTGMLVNLKQITEEEDIMMIADNGIMIRTHAKDISRIGRDTIGVRIIKLKGDAKVMCVAVADMLAEDMTEDGGEDIAIDEPITE